MVSLPLSKNTVPIYVPENKKLRKALPFLRFFKITNPMAKHMARFALWHNVDVAKGS